MSNEIIYLLALTRIPHVGDVQARILLNHFGTAGKVFSASYTRLESVEGIGRIRAGQIRSFRDFSSCEKELSEMQHHGVRVLFITEDNYPRRLQRCHDAPVALYVKGNTRLNAERMIGVVGTRNHDDYGKNICHNLIAGLKDHEVTIISGLAYGIDSIAHRSAIENQLPTVAALAHGLDCIYPWQNKNLAERMLERGGLVSDLGIGVRPDRMYFPRRNRIVAGLCDALVVVQSGCKGGSLITAELAGGYHRDVFALPGRADDEKSAGCLALIRDHKAGLITGPADLIHAMGWEQKKILPKKSQRSLFPSLEPDEETIFKLLKEKDFHIDELQGLSRLSPGKLAAALLSLELKTVIQQLPGKQYRLLG